MVAVGVIKQVTGMTILWRQWFAWFFLPVILTGVITMLVALDISAGIYLWWLLEHKDSRIQLEPSSPRSQAAPRR